MNPFAELPTWVAVLVALFAAVVLVVLNLGWLMAAKSLLDARRRKQAERRGGSAPTSPTTAPPAPGPRRTDERAPTDRTPIL